MKTLALFSAVLLLASSVCARADDASCKPVTDTQIKMANTPYHEVATVDGKPFEKIYTTTTLSLRVNNGRWMTVPMTPQDVLDAIRESGDSYSNCKVLRTETVDGQRAIVYAAHLSLGTSLPGEDNQIWIGANGLTLKTVSDTQKSGRKAHAEAHMTFDNVRAPAGTQ